MLLLSVTGKVIINRIKYGVKSGPKTFFDTIGDRAINDDFDLTFKIITEKI
ncbi:hypothetical protein IC235_11805 [Hymenobacter sp. BT664]|uniref:Uncharacterized protein n=1 Tax=Hymenobacter montanus TaxID=2771359 RepID=A0A927BDU5_9BACT|nr:hypothetical protein [Hymenobacter montanus]MBD2768571.1 hypothetical protein [Hymenobacter montanus]